MLEGGRGHVEFNLAQRRRSGHRTRRWCCRRSGHRELHRPISDVESLARLVFSDVERRELKLAPDPVSAFLNGWTRKEAYVKALGMGLTAPLREITVSLSDRAALFATGLWDQSASCWCLLSVPHPRAVVALALGPRLDSAPTT